MSIAESIDEIQQRRECACIDDVLAELAAELAPEAWQRVERALRLAIALYSTGLERTIDHARAAGVDGAGFDQRLADDDLLGKLLALHRLHPHSPAQRIDATVAKIRGAMGLADTDLAVAAYASGALHLSATPAIAGCEAQICQALESAVPELEQIEITGSSPAAAAA